MRRTLSNIEHLAEANIACSLRLAGRLDLEELRRALISLQLRHPALRALIRSENDVLFYEPDTAPEIPIRNLHLADDEVYRREWEAELSTAFRHHLPQLRVVYFERGGDCDLLLTTSHRLCDALSIFIIVKDVLRSLGGGAAANAHEAVGARDIIGEYRPRWPWFTSAAIGLINTCIRLLPGSKAAPRKKEYWTEWGAGREISASVRQRCRSEGASVHAALLVALDRALWAVLGKRAPKWMTCTIDLRRGRFPALKDDMLFYGGGNFRVRTGRSIHTDFWDSARQLTREIQAHVECEIRRMPPRLFLFERLRPLTCAQANWVVRASEAIRSKRRVKGIGVANLGNIEFDGVDVPLPMKDIRFALRSLNFGILGLIPYTINGDMRFYWTSSENFINERELFALQQEFTRTLGSQIERTCARAAQA